MSTVTQIRKLSKVNQSVELSQGQKRFWFLSRMFGAKDPNKLAVAFEFDGYLDILALNQSFLAVIERHAPLRLKMDEIEGQACPFIQEQVKFALEILDLSEHKLSIKKNIAKTKPHDLSKLMNEFIRRPFDWTQSPLLRAGLYRLNQNKQVLLIVMHHIVADGWSIGILKKELAEFYNAYRSNQKLNLPVLKKQYHSFASSLSVQQDTSKNKRDIEYWQHLLLDSPKQISLPYDFIRKSQSSGEGKRHFIKISKTTTQDLRAFATANRVTSFIVFLSIFNLLIHQYSNNDDIIIGIPLANRREEDYENLIGLFANVIPFRSQSCENFNFVEYMKEMRKQLFLSYEHQDLPFEEIVNHLNIERDSSINPIFQVMFSYLDAEQNKGLSIDQIPCNPMDIDTCHSAFDLTILVKESTDYTCIAFEYSTDLFSQQTIEIMAEHFQNLCIKILAQPTSRITHLSALEAKDIQTQCSLFNQSKKYRLSGKCIHELFQEQVKRTPENIAVVFGNTKLSYAQLDTASNQLAQVIISYLHNGEINNNQNITTDDAAHSKNTTHLIGIYLNRSHSILITILAILKAGCAYVPLDPKYPSTRIEYMMQDAKFSLIITERSLAEKIQAIRPCHPIILDDTNEMNKFQTLGKSITLPKTHHLTLANVIYTSGSTGNPKGVMIEHQSFVETIRSLKHNYFPEARPVNTLSMTNIVFDVFGLEYALPLFTGGCVEIANEQIDEPIECKKYDFIQMTPSHCYMRLEFLIPSRHTLLFIGGESLSEDLLQKLEVKGFSVINVYGPTETTIWSTHNAYLNTIISSQTSNSVSQKESTQASDFLANSNHSKVSIGRALNHEAVYVLNKHLQLLPFGVTGELYIGGIGLARGYLNQPELTQSKFIDNPFQSPEEKKMGKNSKLYKTGDLARWLKDGTLEFIGRNDFQVKIRGSRIELGEIESALMKYPGIQQAVVLVRKINQENQDTGIAGENDIVVGYYIVKKEYENALNNENILNFLTDKLPTVMIPNMLIRLQQFPMTATGKLDRKLLPEPMVSRLTRCLEPRNQTEQTIRRLLAELLGYKEEKISIQDDFFRLGGNSILALQFVFRIHKAFNVKVDISSFFKVSTISSLAAYITDENRQQHNTLVVSKMPIANDSIFPLSFAQERLWFIEEYEQGTTAYNVPLLFKLDNGCNLRILQKSLDMIIQRHQILHTSIERTENGKYFQKVLSKKDYSIDIANIEVTDIGSLQRSFKEFVNQKMDLMNSIPIRFAVYSMNSNEYYLGVLVHHIAFDGWSISLLVQELRLLYQALSRNPEALLGELNLKPLEIQYGDFVLWQRQYLTKELIDKQTAHWMQKLAEFEPLNLITDFPRPPHINYKGETFVLPIEASLSSSLKQSAKELNISLFTLLISGYYLLLSCFSNQKQIVVGLPIANRHYAGVENLIGCFVNTLALPLKIDFETTLLEFIQQVNIELRELQAFQDLPFEKIVEAMNLSKDLGRHPIFQVLFGMNFTEMEGSKPDSASIENEHTLILKEITPKNILDCSAKFDLSLFIEDNGQGLQANFTFGTALFDKSTIGSMASTYIEILKQLSSVYLFTQNEQCPKLASLEYVSKTDANLLIKHSHGELRPFSKDKTIHALFEEQAKRTPNNIAMVFSNIQLTYEILNQQANNIAHYLINKNLSPKNPMIIVCLDRCEHMLAVLLGILKSGSAYVPLDPEYPDERIKYILEDTSSKVLITDKKNAERLTQLTSKMQDSIHILVVDDKKTQESLKRQSKNNVNRTIPPSQLAYVLYTSGTTGLPKGVMIEHGGIVNRLEWMEYYSPLNDKDRILQKTPYVFDVSVWELFWANWKGAAVVFATPLGHKDPDYLLQLIINENITIIHFVPSMLDIFLERVRQNSPALPLQHIICSGEPLSLHQVKKAHTLLPNVRISNLYGPTECSVDVSYYDCSDKMIEKIHIGKPIQNTQLYVLNNYGKLQPLGAVGELHIGGVGLAKGYLNKPKLTQQKFIQNHLYYLTCQHPTRDHSTSDQYFGNRLYKTGDLVRLSPTGDIEYLGRNDFQVKIRGYRIELEEIEKVFCTIPGILQAVVIVQEPIKYLVGYYVASQDLDAASILEYLAKKLPDYMIPSFVLPLDKIPLTINGKLDKRSLPSPNQSLPNNKPKINLPRNELESKLQTLWADILGLDKEKLGIDDDFFRLGGDSIISMQLVMQIRDKLKLNISIKDFFTCKTIAKLAEKYDNVDNKSMKRTNNLNVIDIKEIHKIKKDKSVNDYPANTKNLTTISANNLQQGMIFHHLSQEQPSEAYHVQMVWEYNHSMDIVNFREAWEHALEKYPSLRLRFDWEDKLLQIIDDNSKLNFYFKDLTLAEKSDSLKDGQHVNNLIESILSEDRARHFNLQLGGLFRVYLNKVSKDQYICILSFHHIIMDGWSAQCLVQFVNQQYLNKTFQEYNNIEIEIESDQCYIKAQEFLEQQSNANVDFWEKQLGRITVTDGLLQTLPIKIPGDRRKLDNYRALASKDLQLTINGELFTRLKNLSQSLGLTLHSILQFACHRTLHAYCNASQTILGTIVAGRDLPINNIEHSVGLYINTLPLIVDHETDANMTIREFIENIQEAVLDLNNHGRISLSRLKKDDKPLFNALFVLENYPKLMRKHQNKLRIKFRTVTETLEYPLNFIASESSDKIVINLKYDFGLFDESLIQDMIEVIHLILQQVVSNIEEPIKNLYYLKDTLSEAPIKHNSYIQEQKSESGQLGLVHQHFEIKAAQYPEQIALIHNHLKYSYFELNKQANQIAHFLQQNCLCGPDQMIALCLDRNEKIVISILAVLKTGSAYVPIDPLYPIERIQYILSDSKAPLVITEKACAAKLKAVLAHHPAVRLLVLDDDQTSKLLDQQSQTNLPGNAETSNLAYVIYTSGTTGNPKGVLQQHNNIIRLFSSTDQYFRFNSSDVWTLFHSCAFDFSVWEIWGALVYGGTLVIPTYEETRDLKEFHNLCKRHGVTILNQTPNAFYQFEEIAIEQNANDRLDSLRYVIFGGEALNLGMLKPWFECFGADKPTLINMYGITETTVHVTYKKIEPMDLNSASLIGQVIPDLFAFVLNKHYKKLPTGAIGELFIGGKGLARGYLNKPQLTEQKFIPNPFQTLIENNSGINSKLYKTGDLVRSLKGGEFEYIGRNDFQVKIRGHRIELGEIEATLLTYPGIKGGVVQALEHKDKENTNLDRKYLVGYYLSDTIINEDSLAGHLSKFLPAYMVPTILIPIEHLPLTINGKLDISALPKPTFTKTNNFVTPKTREEKLLCNLWSKTLAIEPNKIGLHDDFFKLGGDSILSIRLVAKANKEFNAHIRVKDLLETRTVARLLPLILASTVMETSKTNYCPFSLILGIELELKNYGIEKDQLEDIYPASGLQMGMLLESDLGDFYHNLSCYSIKVPFNEQKFLHVWKKLIKRHCLLRASFISTTQGWYTAIHSDIPLDYSVHEDLDPHHLMATQKTINIIPEKPGLFRIAINRLQNNTRFDLLFSFHHAIEDGWSMASLINDFIQSYVHDRDIPPIKICYGEFVKNELEAIKDKHQLDFWKKYLADADITNINYKFNSKLNSALNSAANVSELHTESFYLDQSQKAGLKALAERLEISIDLIFLFIYLKTLAIFSANSDVTVGLTVNNRLEKEGGDNLFGLFLNVIPFRFIIEDNKEYELQLKRLLKEKINLEGYKKIPYAHIKTLHKRELFYFGFNFVHFHVLKESIEEIDNIFAHEKTTIPFTLTVSKLEDRMVVKANVHDTFMDKDFLVYWMEYYKKKLNEILGLFIPIPLNKLDYHKILPDWNKTQSTTAPLNSMPQNIVNYFLDQVKRHPNKIAIRNGNRSFTYAQVDNISHKLAVYILQNQHIKPNDIIGIYFDRSELPLIAMLAILKTGAAYTPLDTQYPKERIRYIIEDTGTQLILTSLDLKNTLQNIVESTKIVVVDSSNLQNYHCDDQISVMKEIKGNTLAYVLYTSGTTGHPKGVMIEHRNLVNYIDNLSSYALVTHEDIVDFSTSIGFDLTLTNTLCSLCLGAQVSVYEGDTLEIDHYLSHLMNTGVTLIKLVPSYFSTLIPGVFETNVHKIILGGEKLKPELIDKIEGLIREKHGLFNKTHSAPLKIYDEYGPTECTIGACISLVYPERRATIGKPYNNTQIYILDKNNQLVPVGVKGEIVIGGYGVARGYLNQQSLTTEKFIADPFNKPIGNHECSSDILYKTGDIGRWLLNGEIEYCGRMDTQVKLRGHRIELKEIETQILQYPEIEQAIVLISESLPTKAAHLIAYIVPKSSNISLQNIKQYLNSHLPPYMVPPNLILIESIPLTPNGKLDTTALLQSTEKSNTNPLLIPPRNELESKITSLWCEVLNLQANQLSIEDNFFEIGGDSILSIQLTARIKQELGLPISIKDIFKYKTIASLHDVLNKINPKNSANTIYSSNTTIGLSENLTENNFSLLPIQSWFFNRNLKNCNHFNQSFIIKVQELDINKLNQAIHALIQRHDTLRLAFRKSEENGYVQYYRKSIKTVPIEVLNIQTLETKYPTERLETKLFQILTQWQSQFDIDSGNLYKIGYLHGFSDHSARIWFAFHHLIIDAVSWRVILDDLYALYHNNPLNEKTCKYDTWVEAIKNYPQVFSHERDYWQKLTHSYRKSRQSLQKNIIMKANEAITKTTLQLDPQQTEALLRKCHSKYNTSINDLLLTALAFALQHLTGDNTHFITLEGHGREAIFANIDPSRTVGWFTTIFPVRLEISQDLGASLMFIKETLRLIPNKGIGFGPIIGYQDAIESVIPSNSEESLVYDLPKINFNYLGQFGQKTSGERWTIANEKSGIQVDPHNGQEAVIDMNGLVIDRKLSIYVSTRLNSVEHEKFCSAYKNTLLDIIAHCADSSYSLHTMNDFEDYTPYEILNEHHNVCLFMFPPSMGGIECYMNNIAPHLTELKLVLLNNFYQYLIHNAPDSLKTMTIENLAINYMALIKSIQPEGPYHFMGWSLGGILAFEVARQLRMQGDTVENVVLIDALFDASNTAASMGINVLSGNDIRTRYLPPRNTALFDQTKFVLFKATKSIENNDYSTDYPSMNVQELNLINHYANHISDNHLEKWVERSNLERMIMPHTHFSWIKCDQQIDAICNKILLLMRQIP